MRREHAALAVALLALVAAAVAIVARPTPSDHAGADLAPLAARLDSVEGRLGEVSESLGELSKRARRTDVALGRLSEKLERAAAKLAEMQAADRARPAPPSIPVGIKFHDAFEAGTSGWVVIPFAPIVIGTVKQTTAQGQAKEGRGALALSYSLEAGKLPVTVRGASRINHLSFWIRTVNRSAEVYVGAHERDDSRYGMMVHLEPGQGWQRLDLDLTTYVLDKDSHDENGKLDFYEIDGISIADAAGFMGGVGPNTLLVDEVVGEYREPADGEDEDRF